jgi:Na+-driven multidrug efflux pump
MPSLGCQQGLQPIFGYNWGARNFARVYLTFKCGLAATGILCFAAFVVQVVPPFPGLIAKMFISSGNPEVLSLATSDLQLSNCMIFCAALNIVSTTYFQSIGRPLVALTLSLLRQGLVLLPAIWFLPYLFDDKPFAIWLAMPLADVVCFVATFIPLYFHRRFLTRVKSREAVRFSFGSR